MNLVGVKFSEKGKIYYFDSNDIELEKGKNVIVETEKGLQYGQVSDKVAEKNIDKNIEYKKVIRKATKKDNKQHQINIKDAENAIKKCRKMIEELELPMKIIDASYTFNRSQLIFRFLSDERVDFRKLAKDLGSMFKTRIELRQVGIRDKAKEIGGIGPCGRLLCCNKFLTEFDSVSINMAKNQSLSLNPTKINGVCGRLLCCLTYENDNYDEYKKGMPTLGKKYNTPKGVEQVISVDLFNRKYKVLTENNEIIERTAEDYDSKK